MFGGNTGFGAKPAGTGFGFGATNNTQQQPLGGGFNTGGNTAFNKPATGFGSPAGGTGFGASPSGGFGGGGGFGATPAFGAQTTGFGAAKPAFATSNTVTNNLAGLGGGMGAGGGWGANSGGNTLGGLGGGTTFGGGGLGGAAAPAFGQAAGGSPFGARTTSLGGATGAGFGGGLGGQGAFGGGGATSSFGNTGGAGAFGGGGNAFGAPAATSNAFGGGGLGGGGAFGQQPQALQTGGGFGFGGAAAPAFGAPASSGTAFGGGGLGGAFGSSPQQQQQQGGTGNPPFRAHTVTETMTKNGHQQSTQCSIQVITAMQAYQHKSVEELRLEDYARGNKGPGSTGGGLGLGGATSTLGNLGGGFGGGNAFGAKPATSLGGFGAAPATGFGAAPGGQSAFGAPAGGAFGSTSNAFGGGATTGFGAPAAGGFGGSTGGLGGGGFGATANTGAGGFGFGGQAAATPAFGAATGGAFGQPATGGAFGQPAAGGAFGQPATGGAFGQPAAGGAFGQPAAGGAFGQPAAGGGFGQPAAGGAFGQPATGGAFGQPAASGGFGQAAAGGGFGGFGTTQAKPATGGFGGATGGFGSTLGGGTTFGGAAPATTGFGGFGAAAPAAGGGGGFGGALGGGNTFGGGAATSGFGTTAAAPAAGGFGGFGSPLGGGLGGATGGFGKSPGGFGSTAAPAAGGFGAPAAGGATGGFGGLGGGGFGGFGTPSAATTGSSLNFSLSSSAPAGGGFGGFGNTGGFGATNNAQATPGMGTSGAPMTNMQQQQQLLLQVASLQQQQQQQDVADRIQMLRRKKDELAQNGPTIQNDSLVEQKSASNLFSGFVGAKAQAPAYYRTSPRSTARIVPRGVRGLTSPVPTQPGSGPSLSSASQSASGSSTAVTPYKNENILSPEPFSLGRNAKKLIVSSFKSPMPDPTEDLPPIPHSSANTPQAYAQQTPHRMDVSNTGGARTANANGHGQSSGRGSGVTYSSDTADFNKGRSGEATGLTPAHAGTPYYARRNNEMPNDLDEEAGNHTNFASPVSFRLSPKDHSRSSSGRARPVSPDEEDEPNSAAAPILTLPGYQSCPDISVLQKYSAKELAKVRQFTVFRPNYGKIEWIGETDVRNLNLDDIVKIEKKEVFVYEDVTPVAEGTGLNKPAVVTLHNVFPKEGSTEKKKAEFYRKLQDFCESNEADFISYDRTSGDWVFGVKHFSRYGIADSDDEDDAPRNPAEMEEAAWPSEETKSAKPFDAPVSSLAAHNIMKLRTMLTTNAPRSRVVDLSPRKPSQSGDYYSSVIGTAEKRSSNSLSGDVPEHDESDSPPLTRRRVDELLSPAQPLSFEAAKREDKSYLLTMEQVRLASQASKSAYVSESFSSYQAFHLTEDSPCMKIMMQVKMKAAQATGVALDTSAAAYTQPRVNTGALSSVSTLQKGMSNYALSMGRSFRVGWSKDGKIVHSGKFTFTTGAPIPQAVGSCHRVVVEKVDTFRWARSHKGGAETTLSPAPETSLEAPLVAMLNASHQTVVPNHMTESESAAKRIVSASLSKLPLWCLPAADPAQLHEYVPFLSMLKTSIAAYQAHAPHSRHPDWVVGKALELIDATYGQEKTTFSADAATRAVELLPLYEDRLQYAPEVWERRRALLSNWIETVTCTQVKQIDEADNGQFGQSAKTYNRLFELLSCRRLNDAVSLAEKAGMFRLATLLSQLDGDASIPTLIRNQLAMWKVSEADLTIAPELVKLYRLLAGTVITEDASGSASSSMLGLGWLRGVGILFWYCSSTDSFVENISTLSSSLENYRIVLQDLFVDPPVSPYLLDKDTQGADVSYPSTVHGLYALLELLFPSHTAASMDIDEAELVMDLRNNVIAALRPNGYTRDALDYRASYLILVMLESAGISQIDAVHAHIIRQHYISQLLSAGLWQWALFVALQVPDLSARYCLVSDIVLRFGGECDWEDEKHAADRYASPSLYSFLTTALNLPEAFLHEASAFRAGYEHLYSKQVSSLISARRFRLATEVTVTHIAPKAMLASGAAASEVLTLLETINNLAEAEASELTYRSTYADHWTDLSAVFLPFLRLKRTVAALGNAQSDCAADEMRAAMEVPDIMREARQLLERLTTLHQQRKTHILRGNENNRMRDQSGGLNVVSSEQKLIQVVLFDMGTYLYSLLQRLEMTDFSGADEPSTVGGSQLHVNALLTREHMDLAPVLNEKLANTASRCNSEFLQFAASRLVVAHN